MKGVVSAKKALQGSENETKDLLGVTEDIYPRRGPFRQINDFLAPYYSIACALPAAKYYSAALVAFRRKSPYHIAHLFSRVYKNKTST